MAIHCSMLDWKTPRTVELGRLQARGLQRVGHPSTHVRAHTLSRWQHTRVHTLSRWQHTRVCMHSVTMTAHTHACTHSVTMTAHTRVHALCHNHSTHTCVHTLSRRAGSHLLSGKKEQTILPQPGQHSQTLPLTEWNHTVSSRPWHCLGNWAACPWWACMLLSSSSATYSRPKLHSWHLTKFCWLKKKKNISVSFHFSDIFRLWIPSKKLKALAVWKMLRITKKHFQDTTWNCPYIFYKNLPLDFLDKYTPSS